MLGARRVEWYRRTADNDWLFHEYLAGCGECRFPVLEVSVLFEEISRMSTRRLPARNSE